MVMRSEPMSWVGKRYSESDESWERRNARVAFLVHVITLCAFSATGLFSVIAWAATGALFAFLIPVALLLTLTMVAGIIYAIASSQS